MASAPGARDAAAAVVIRRALLPIERAGGVATIDIGIRAAVDDASIGNSGIGIIGTLFDTRPADSLRAPGLRDARCAGAAVPIDGAGAASRDARAAAVVTDEGSALFVGIGHTRQAIAAVRARRTSAARLDAFGAGAARNAEAILFAAIDAIAVAAAAVAGRVAARRRQFANGAVGIAPLGVATYAHGRAFGDLAGDGFGEPFRSRHAFGAAAIAIFRADSAGHLAAARGLADENPGRAPRSAGSAAAFAPTIGDAAFLEHRDIAIAELAIEQAAIGGPRRRFGA